MALTWYLTIDGVDGGSNAAGQAGAFVVDDYSFDVSALVGALSGAAAGEATFSPLTVDLVLGSGLTTLLGDVASGTRIKSIELQGVTTGGTVYDLRLGNVVITRLHDSNSGLDSLSFDYSQGAVSLTTTVQNPDGTLGATDTMSWDVAHNVSLGGAILAPPVAGSVDTGGGGAQTWYLTIDGVDGGSNASGHAGAFVIGDFSFDVSALVGALSGGGGAGKTTFSPLTVDLTLASGLTTLLGDVAGGKHIRSVELQGVTPAGTVYDLVLNDVFITRVHDGISGLDSLSFDYSHGSVSLTTSVQNPDGTLGASDTLSWDVANNKSLGGAILPSPVAGSVDTGGGGAQTWYLTVAGVDGGSNASGHAGAFAIDDFDFDVSALISATSGGGGAGKTTFSPLTVDLTLGSGLTTLLGDAANGQRIKAIEIQGVTSGAQPATVYDLVLNDVFITRVHDSNSGLDRLSFDYSHGSVSLTTTSFASNGAPQTDTLSWDVANNVSLGGATLPPPVAGSVDTGGGGAQTWYLTIEGVDGGATASGHAGAFVIGDFDFDVSALVSATSGGKATFSPLTVDLALGSGLTTLLGDVAGGKHIKAIELQGVTAAGQAVYDLVLNDVFITRVHDGISGLDSLSFDYSHGSVSLTTTPIDSTGGPGTPDTLSWDVANNISLQGAALPPPVAGPVDTGGGGAQTWYLTVDGVDGGSNAAGHAGAFVIGDFSFDVTALVSALSGGGGADKTTFSPLTVDLTVGSGLTTLLGDVARGRHIKAIELQGVTTAGQKVYDLVLNDVFITRVHDGNSGLDSLSFDYSHGSVSLTTRPIRSDGSLGAADTLSWDVANNVSLGGATLASPVAGSVDTGGGGAQTWYLTVDGVDGGSNASGHAGAFVISDYSFDVSGLVGALSGGGAAGKATFSPLTVDLALGSGLTALLGDIASGTHIKGIELQGVTSGQTPATVYDLKLGNVVITRVHDGNSGLDRLSFDYSQGTVSLTTTAFGPGGAPQSDTMSWDVANNKPLVAAGPSVTDLTTPGEKVAHGATVAVGIVTPGSPGDTLTLTELSGPPGAVTLSNGIVSVAVPADAAGATLPSPVAGSVDTGGGGAQTWYLTIDGVDGGSNASGHAGAFVIGDYSFDVSALVGALSGGGGAGKTTFAPLTVDLTLASGLTTLLGDVAGGKHIKAIELQGVTTAGTVYDLRLSNVVITKFHDGISGLDSLSFDYSQGSVSLTTRAQNPDGSLGPADTLSWDVANNVNLGGATLAPPVAGSVDTGGGGAQTWYLTVDGVDGGSNASGHAGAFVIGDFKFDVSALVSALSGGGGAAGKATFSPLTVDLALGSGLTTLLGDVAGGMHIRAIEIQGVTSGAQPAAVYDLVLNDVFVTKVHDGNSGLDSLSFDYSHGSVSLTTTSFGSNGAPQTDTMSWDVANNVSLSGAALPPPVAGSVDTGGGGAQTWYLTIDGVDGGANASGHAGAFVVGDFDFDVSALISATSGGGAAGKTTFPPLTVDLTLGSGLTTLLGDLAGGKHIKAIELQGVTTTGQTVYDLRFNDVFVTRVHDGISGLDSLSFDYSEGSVSLTTTPINSTGGAGTPDTLSWDVANNVSLGGAILPPPVAGSVDTGGGGAQTWYLTIDGVDGGSTASGHAGAFVIGDFDFDVSALISATSGGKTTFSPLTVDLALGSGLTTLLGDVAGGRHIKAIELQGVTTAGTVYDLRLSNVVIAKFHDGISGLDSLSFDYSQGSVSLTTRAQNPNGSLGAPDTLSWDVANNISLQGAALPPPVASSVDTGGGGAQTWYLTIDGVDGGSNASGHAGAFVIGDFNFDVTGLVSALSGGGGAGKATFSPLTVDLSLSSGLTTLLGDVAGGKHIRSIELQGVTSTGQTAYDLRLSNVTVTKLHDGNSGLDSLSFDYSQGSVSLTTRPITSSGSLGAADTLSWDVAHNVGLGGAILPPPVAGPVDTGGGGAQTWYLTIDGVDGGSTASGHAGAFVIADYSFDVSGLVGALSGGGGAGKATFSPLTVDLALGSGLTALLGDVAGGRHIKAIELQGVTTSGQTVYDLRLSNVVITTFHDSSGLDSLSFDYSQGAVSLTTRPIRSDGSLGASVTLSWDVANNAAIANPTGTVAFSYQVSDQLGHVSGVVSDTLTIDPGPSVTDTTTAGETVAHGTTVTVGTVAPGLPGDTLTLTQLSGQPGTLTLANGVVSFTAPANGSGAFSYQITDQVGDVSAVVADALTIDPGPSVTDTTTAGEKVAHGTTVTVGTVTPGLPGDTLTLTQLGGPAGALTLANGIVSFAAPANASGNVSFSYQIGDVSAVISDTLAIDPGPKAGNAHLYASPGQSVDLTSVLLALDTAGLPGDTLTLSAVGTAGTLGTVSLNHGDLVYTAPTGGSSDLFTYTVADQLHESATANVAVSLLGKNASTALTGSGNIVITTDGNRTVTGGTGGNYVSLGSGNDGVSLGGDNNTVVLGNGNDSVSLSGKNNIVRLGNGNDSVTAGAGSTITFGNGNDSVTAGAGSTITLGNGNDSTTAGAGSTITLGNGNDSVTAGAGSTIMLGNGNDLVYAGANSTVVVGNGNNTVFAGANDTITLGTGHDLVAFGASPGLLAIGNEVVSGFGKGDTLQFNHLLLPDFKTAMQDARQMAVGTVITIDSGDSVTLKGVAMTSLTASNFKFS